METRDFEWSDMVESLAKSGSWENGRVISRIIVSTFNTTSISLSLLFFPFSQQQCFIIFPWMYFLNKLYRVLMYQISLSYQVHAIYSTFYAMTTEYGRDESFRILVYCYLWTQSGIRGSNYTSNWIKDNGYIHGEKIVINDLALVTKRMQDAMRKYLRVVLLLDYHLLGLLSVCVIIGFWDKSPFLESYVVSEAKGSLILLLEVGRFMHWIDEGKCGCGAGYVLI